MHVRLALGGSPPRRWHLVLLDRIAARPGVTVEAEDEGRSRPVGGAVRALLRLDAILYPRAPSDLAAPVPAAALDAYARRGIPDLVIELGPAPDGVSRDPGPRQPWRLLFDRIPGEAALIGALVRGACPVGTVERGGRVLAIGRLGTDWHGVIRGSLEDALARTITLILAAFDEAASPPLPRLPEPSVTSRPSLARVVVRHVARALARRVYGRLYRQGHWRVGWRRRAGPDMLELGRHPGDGWAVLPDDGSRFYADPFPLLHDGTVTLFVEDYVHARRKGVISAVRIGPDGPVGVPEPVLEEPHHLSYPFVFERDGEAWMVPESGANRSIDLYRAAAFPGGWTKVATLVDNVVASDATLLEQAGTWWMFATVKDSVSGVRKSGGSVSDALHLWWAPDFRGPWTAHARNPVLIDAASARPAGRVTCRDGVLLRPAQDCRREYGGALAIARIDRLDREGYAQHVDAIVTSGPGWPGRCLHTWNEAGGFEFIDGSADVPRGRFGRS